LHLFVLSVKVQVELVLPSSTWSIFLVSLHLSSGLLLLSYIFSFVVDWKHKEWVQMNYHFEQCCILTTLFPSFDQIRLLKRFSFDLVGLWCSSFWYILLSK
jgi:hypothetical protein